MSARHEARARWVEEALAKHEGPLLQYATRLLGDPHAARDVVQDSFLRLCGQAPAALDGHLAPWLYRVCRNRAMDVRRRGKIVPKTNADVLEGTASPPAPPGAAADDRDAAAAVLRALGALPEAQQEVLRLRLSHGLSYRDIAEVTGLTVSNVGVLIHEGLKALRKRLSLAAIPAPVAAHVNDGGPR